MKKERSLKVVPDKKKTHNDTLMLKEMALIWATFFSDESPGEFELLDEFRVVFLSIVRGNKHVLIEANAKPHMMYQVTYNVLNDVTEVTSFVESEKYSFSTEELAVLNSDTKTT